jgi:hypothetical protein
MSGRIPPSSSIGPRLVAVASRRGDGVFFGLTTGPTPAGLVYADGEAMLCCPEKVELGFRRRCSRPTPSRGRAAWEGSSYLCAVSHEAVDVVSTLIAPLDLIS